MALPFSQSFPFSGPNVQAYMNPPYNVRNFGALGNNMTDDTAACQAALDACGTAGGGVVYFPTAFGYLISTTLLVWSNTLVIGDGGWNSMIYASNTFVGHDTKDVTPGPSVCLMANTELDNTETSVPVQFNITLDSIGFNGNGYIITKPGANPGATAFFRMTYNITIRNCEFINGSSSAIEILGIDAHQDWPGIAILPKVYDNHINLLYNPNGPPPLNGVMGSSGFPIVIRGAGYGVVRDNIIGDLFDSLSIHTNDGIDIPGSPNMIVENNYISNCGDGIGTNAADDATIVGNYINKNGGYGISSFSSGGPTDDPVGCNNMTVVGNTITDSGFNPGTNPGKTGIRFSTPGARGTGNESTNGTIVGNTIHFDDGAGGPFGIHVEGNYCTVSGNTIDLGQAQKSDGGGLTGITVDAGPGGGNYATVTGNTVSNGYTGAQGIVIQTANGNNVTGLVCTGNNIDPTSITTPWVVPAGPQYSSFLNSFVHSNSFQNTIGQVTPTPIGPGGGSVNSGVAYTNPFPYNIWVTLNLGAGSTISQIALGGNTMFNASVFTPLVSGQAYSVYLLAGESITVTFTGSNISWIWLVR